MPYLGVHSSKKLTVEERTGLKAKLGEAISLIPNKTEAVLMIEFLESADFYFAGSNENDYVYVDLRCFQNAPIEDNRAFTTRVYEIFGEVLGMESNKIYLTIAEYPIWGARGRLLG